MARAAPDSLLAVANKLGRAYGRGLHSLTSQLKLSAFYGIGMRVEVV